MDPFDRLHPGLQYHLANTLRWSGLRPPRPPPSTHPHRGDTLVLAPTAGGKTEAAIFPLLSRMASEDWQGVSILYVCPLRALLNNLQPRIDGYCQWLGRTAAVWHGDVYKPPATHCCRPARYLLTTPESLESMLVSTKSIRGRCSPACEAVVVDEIHAFAGDDRGWHLSASWNGSPDSRTANCNASGYRPPWAIPQELSTGCRAASSRDTTLVAPEVGTGATAAEITVDYVGSLPNAATVIAALHSGEKRLVFVEAHARPRNSAPRCVNTASKPSSPTPPCQRPSAAAPKPPSPRHGHRHRRHLHPGTRHRRRRSGPGHPDRLHPHCRLLSYSASADWKAPPATWNCLFLCVDDEACCWRRECSTMVRRLGGTHQAARRIRGISLRNS